MIRVGLDAGAEAALAGVPAAPGVGQILGPEDRSLVLARAANLRRWAARQLGKGGPTRKGSRPPLDLSPVATALAYETTSSEFQQRLLFERLMAPLVPLPKRRDLKPPAWLHLDSKERFPRLSVRADATDPRHLFGPFRDRRAAERARDALQKRHALRPCDFTFEPDPALPLGLGCLFAQVRSCAAPCLARVSEDAYRGLGAEVERRLCEAGERDKGDALPAWIAPRAGTRAVVIEAGREGIELYPIRDGVVLEAARAVVTRDADVEDAIAGLAWPEPAASCDDTAWLSAWLHERKRKGVFRVLT